MANPHKGEVSFEAAGKSYTLRFSADAICDLEESLGLPMAKIGAQMTDPETMRMSNVRALFESGLKDRHPDLTGDAARAVFKALSPIEAIRLVSAAFNAAYDAGDTPPADPRKPDGTPNPGTGPASIAHG